MNAHARETYDAITQGRAPRSLSWTEFVSFWDEVADDVEPGTGDQLTVHLNGHRTVFRRQHDGRVSIEDVERARHLLAASPRTSTLATSSSWPSMPRTPASSTSNSGTAT